MKEGLIIDDAGIVTQVEKVQPITKEEFGLAMTLVKSRWPNAAFVIQQYLLEQKEAAFTAGTAADLDFSKNDPVEEAFKEWEATQK